MSLVTFPFKEELPATVVRSVEIAARHPRVRRVLAVGAEEDEAYHALVARIPGLQRETGTEVEVLIQKRIGTKRPGKGDGMNTALRWFLEETDLERIHFYDSDITSFTADWISAAEASADLGYAAVRHYFPRASTHGMITFLISRTGFALLWPKSELSWIEQPLGGEVLFTRRVAQDLAENRRVQEQSDWGIDTVLTFFTVERGFPIYETYRPEGKVHTRYRTLSDLRTVVVECFAVIQDLAGRHPGPCTGPAGLTHGIVHRVEPGLQVSLPVYEQTGFDFEGALSLLSENWTPRQEELLDRFPPPIREGLLRNRQHPCFTFLGEWEWVDAYRVLLECFQPGDTDWEQLLFRLWTIRVLNYTVTSALRGYGFARRYRRNVINRYLREAVLGIRNA